MKKLRILLTGGGTGGHIYPLIAVANEITKQANQFGINLDMRYFGSEREYAETIVENNIDFVPIISSKLRRYWSPLNLIDIPKFFLSIIQLLWKIFWFMPDIIFSKGGPGALASVLVGRFYRIPVIIHESDSIPGLTNKISGSHAIKIFLAFASAAEYFKNQNIIEVVGNPVRESLFSQALPLSTDEENRSSAKKGFGLNTDEPIILIIGGSQGAERFNNFILENLEILIKDFQVLHQVGPRNYEGYKKAVAILKKYKTSLDKVAEALVKKETLEGEDFEKLLSFSKPAIATVKS